MAACQAHDLCARGLDAMELPLEAERVLGEGTGTNGPPMAPVGVGDCHPAEVETELREHAADAARLGIVASPPAN